jgi:hypothetical protein
MPIVKLGDEGRWTNYHGTGTCEAATRFALRSGDAPRGRDEIAIAAKSVQDWLAQAATAKRRVRPLGAGWSPSNVNISSQSWLLHTRRFNRCFRIGADDVRSGIDAGTLMLVEAGALVDEVSDKFEEQGRSLWTSGAGNGQTFAGAAATGTHGSMIARGGIQDHIRAVQIVTPAGIHWIEPETGVMSDAFIAATGSAVLRDDAMFAAAQLPVGSLGIVTALIVDSVPEIPRPPDPESAQGRCGGAGLACRGRLPAIFGRLCARSGSRLRPDDRQSVQAVQAAGDAAFPLSRAVARRLFPCDARSARRGL